MAWSRAPGVIYEVLDGKALLLDENGTELITLNAVGTLVWQELDGRRENGELAAALADRFADVTVQQLEDDIAAFVEELEASALVVRGDATP